MTGLGTDTVVIKTDITETGEMTDVTETRITLMSCGDTRRTPADTRNTAGTKPRPILTFHIDDFSGDPEADHDDPGRPFNFFV